MTSNLAVVNNIVHNTLKSGLRVIKATFSDTALVEGISSKTSFYLFCFIVILCGLCRLYINDVIILSFWRDIILWLVIVIHCHSC